MQPWFPPPHTQYIGGCGETFARAAENGLYYACCESRAVKTFLTRPVLDNDLLPGVLK
jgi:hypothetical protein